jgi:hypothetical protein
MSRPILAFRNTTALSFKIFLCWTLALLFITSLAGGARAQSPEPSRFSGDALPLNPNMSWPTNHPNAGVVEALDFTGYSGNQVSDTEELTANWLDGLDGSNSQVVTEISVTSNQFISTYETDIDSIINEVVLQGAVRGAPALKKWSYSTLGRTFDRDFKVIRRERAQARRRRPTPIQGVESVSGTLVDDRTRGDPRRP